MAALIDPEAEQERREKQREYSDFLEDGDSGPYMMKIKQMIEEKTCRLIVNINDLRNRLPIRTSALLEHGFEEVVCFQNALKEIVGHTDDGIDLVKSREEFFVGFEGSFGSKHVSPRTLKSRFLGNTVCCEGIVTKCSLVRPKVVRSVHYCPATEKTMERRYTDLTSFDAFPSSSVYPTTDENKNPLETEFGLSSYKDHQTFSIQELPENAPAGQLPRSVDVVADGDLADWCKPGDRVRVVGMFRCLPNKQNGFTNGTFRTILIANNIQLQNKDVKTMMSAEETKLIRKTFMKEVKNKPFDVLSRSLAPSIHGHDEVKKAILLMLVGGLEKILHNGTRLRGDINVLLIGDPSVAKSQLLRYVLHTAPRAIPTTGRGSSGVGLTAAVTTDSETGERRLEAGAMVLGDRGIVCIDEFDKMSDIDRTAIHEVMEQGRVTIAKAGIHAKLNARCSVLAAANPVYGRYDLYKTPMENIGMQDSLLSRFDLLFVLLDEHESERDKAIASHVVKLHSFRTPGEEDGAPLEIGTTVEALTTFNLEEDREGEEAGGATQIWEQASQWTAGNPEDRIVTMNFMKKFITLAKEVKPSLTDGASTYIGEKYADLREFDETKEDRERTSVVTARTLETLIRLATAHAKIRLHKKVERQDAEAAFRLLHFALFKEKPKERLEQEERKRRRHGDEESGESGDEDDNENYSNRTTKTRTGDREEDDEEIPTSKRARRDEEEDSSVQDSESLEPAVISVDRYRVFKKHLRSVFDEIRAESAPLDEVVKRIQARIRGNEFTRSEVEAALERLSDDNAAMVTEGNLVLI